MVLLVSIAAAPLLGEAAWSQCHLGQQQNPDQPIWDDFGRSVSVDEEFAVIGSPLDSADVGTATVLRREESKWVVDQVLHAPSFQPHDLFGYSVAISGDVIVVGAPERNSPLAQQGAAFVFRRRGSAWIHEDSLSYSRGSPGALFGWSVDVDSNRIIIGARDATVKGVVQAGSAHVFRFDGHWNEESLLLDPDPRTLDLFGGSVSIDGDSAIVGAHGDGSGGGAFVFDRMESEWRFRQHLVPGDLGNDDRFGFATALRGVCVLIGAYNQDGPDGLSAGTVYSFVAQDNRWVQSEKLYASDAAPFDWFGRSASLNATTTESVIGAMNEGTMGFEAGAAYLFRRLVHTWRQAAKLTAPDGGRFRHFGTSVSIHNETALIGATNGSRLPGTAYLVAIPCGDPDLDGDACVGFGDLLVLLSSWGDCLRPCFADLTGDDLVDANDLIALLVHWDSSCSGSSLRLGASNW